MTSSSDHSFSGPVAEIRRELEETGSMVALWAHFTPGAPSTIAFSTIPSPMDKLRVSVPDQ